MKRIQNLFFAFFVLSSLLTGCNNSPVTTQVVIATKEPNQNVNPITPTQVLSTPTQTVEATSTVTSTPKLKAEDWMNWPIVPEVTEKAKELYRMGIAMGNNTHAFSKVGDCQNIKNAFLGFFDHPGLYQQNPDYVNLLDTIENFKGYFDRDGEATRFGFTAASPLSPLMAISQDCQPDENPLECELRLTKPTFVVISLEFAFKDRTAEVYERYMRQIIEYTMSKGAVPILSTKADNMERDNSINFTTAKLALEYDLPLWNFWAEAQKLPDKGMDMYRNDGFHISVLAWEKRSFTFLQTLDHLWKGLRDLK
jgi:hypothetical protein